MPSSSTSCAVAKIGAPIRTASATASEGRGAASGWSLHMPKIRANLEEIRADLGSSADGDDDT